MGEHFTECAQNPRHPDHGVYACICEQIVADEFEAYQEMLVDAMREEGW